MKKYSDQLLHQAEESKVRALEDSMQSDRLKDTLLKLTALGAVLGELDSEIVIKSREGDILGKIKPLAAGGAHRRESLAVAS